jgi:hypothetical protein
LAVTTHKIGGGAVTDVKLAGDAVTSTKILNGSIQGWDLDDEAVTDAKIAAGTITGSRIAAGTITAANVATNGGIYSSKSRIYEAVGTGVVNAGFCVQVIAQCNDANDLPLIGTWAIPVLADATVSFTSAEDWDSLVSPAKYRVQYCLHSGSTTQFEAKILCIEVD